MIICIPFLKDCKMNNGWSRGKKKREWVRENSNKKKTTTTEGMNKNINLKNLRWLAPSTILRWWRRDGIRRNCGGEWDCWPRAVVVVAVDGAAAPLNLRNLLPMLLLFWLPVVAVMVAEVRSGPDIWTRRKKAKCCEQHLYSDLQALFDGVSKPNVFSSFWWMNGQKGFRFVFFVKQRKNRIILSSKKKHINIRRRKLRARRLWSRRDEARTRTRQRQHNRIVGSFAVNNGSHHLNARQLSTSTVLISSR